MDISGRLSSFGRLIASVGEEPRTADTIVSSPVVDKLLTSVVRADSMFIYDFMILSMLDKMAFFYNGRIKV